MSIDLSNDNTSGQLEKVTFGAGCFWCIEAVFQTVEGVEEVLSGYTGGVIENPTYKDICTGMTGHAEVAQISYDPLRVTFRELLEVFWKTHDPTTLNRQGNDIGTQYRSVIFYHDDTQKKLSEEYKKELENAAVWPDPIVTEISPLGEFYPAEAYHQNYYRQNSSQPYCTFVIKPKLEKIKQVFGHKLKKAL